ncbi:hypothetical protein [Mycoplasma sp. HU2014]|uniref:hypothetical protein n=1 Tax=Mycoplasma sp. HU2014 TaxID=1664275 RepID=UPI00067E4DDE|nr:hypothetical protein [Mycoplasma sp. HU2014]KNG79545.1 CinA family protein [Mycoplasma sp. HU2014]
MLQAYQDQLIYSLKELVKLLKDKQITFSTCEPFINSIICNSLKNIEDSSTIYKGEYKDFSINFDPNIIVKPERIKVFARNYHQKTKELAEKLATETREKKNTNIAISFISFPWIGKYEEHVFTNNPLLRDLKQVCYVGISLDNGETFVRKHQKNSAGLFAYKMGIGNIMEKWDNEWKVGIALTYIDIIFRLVQKSTIKNT